jgi:hypothetical protein
LVVQMHGFWLHITRTNRLGLASLKQAANVLALVSLDRCLGCVELFTHALCQFVAYIYACEFCFVVEVWNLMKA